MQKVSVIITDLDNTLYDWVEMWYQSFGMFFNQLVLESGVDEETLETETKAIFRKHRTSEYRFLIHDLPALRMKHPDEDLLKKYASLLFTYQKACEDGLCLYPSVLETLTKLKDLGCLIIAFTGSKAYYAAQRVKILGLDGIFDYMYSPLDHNIPSELDLEGIFQYSADAYKLQHSVHRYLAPGMVKPNAKVLLDIIKDADVSINQVIYVGDSLIKDIIMAQEAHVTDVQAQYGIVQHTEAYEFLRRFSHWTNEDFKSEDILDERSKVCPTYVLKDSFDELMTFFDFIPYSKG